MRFPILLLTVLLQAVACGGSPQGASNVTKQYELLAAQWSERLKTAVDPAAQQQVWKQRPDPEIFAERVWAEVQGELTQEWTLEYCTWLLEYTPSFVADPLKGKGTAPVELIRQAVEKNHLKSAKVGRLCLSMTALPNPQTLTLVEKVAKENPNKGVQGQAALASAMLLKGLGGERSVMTRRLTRLREAIIKAADVKVGNVSVAQLAEDELFVISNLSKGRQSPDIIGRDATGTAFKLSQIKSKVIVLAFWHTSMRDADRGIGLLRDLHTKYGNRGMTLIGVSSDSLEVLRKLSGNGTVPWRNFSDVDGRITGEYRVRSLPLVYVLDQRRVIQMVGGPGSFVDATVLALLNSR